MHSVDHRRQTPRNATGPNNMGKRGGHRGFVVCGFPATCDDPAAEVALAFPIGDPNFVEAFLDKRMRAIEELTQRTVHMATVASASTPAVQSFGASSRKWVTS